MTSSRYRRSPTEGEMLRVFFDLARSTGGYAWHVRDARGQAVAGMPDLIVAVPPVLALYELKTQGDRTSPLQADVLETIEQCSLVFSGVVRPVPRTPDEMTIDEAVRLIARYRPELEIDYP